MKKVFLGLLIAVILIITSSFQTMVYAESTATTFTDISGHWAGESIEIAVDKGYVAGYPDGTFKPDGQVTRAELLKMVVTALGIVEGPTIEGAQWYENYVSAAFAEGIYKKDFTGDINLAITRQELALLAIRATNSDIRNQTDFDTKRVMYEATKAGIIQGLGKGELGVEKSTTRAQAVAIIERILKIKSGETLPVDKHAVNLAEVVWHGTNAFTMMEYAIGKSDPRWNQIAATLNTFNPTNMTIEIPVGSAKVIKKVIDALLFIDLDDPNDPNINLVSAEAKVFPFSSDAGPYYLKNYKNAFVIIAQGRELKNNDKTNYAGNDKFFMTVNSGVNIDFNRIVKGDITNQGAVPIFIDHIGENLDAKVLSKDFKYFPTIDSVIISKPPAPTYQKNIFKLALIN